MKRNPHTPDEKAKLVLEALSGERTINEIASEHNVHPSMLTRWKKDVVLSTCTTQQLGFGGETAHR